MASLRPPSTSPSPSPVPQGRSSPNPPANGTPNRPSAANARASMGPSRSPSGQSPLPSPRPVGMIGGGRPTSELLAGGTAGAMFQTPEADAIDQWFENLQNYEATLEEMAAASLDVNFKEELSAIEQWFRVLSEAERTAALYSLLQHSTQVQIRFFITVLQQMARSDPMTALLSPAVGGSMQAQMEQKLQSLALKSPGMPSPRNVSGAAPASPAFLDVTSPTGGSSADAAAAATLQQQRAKLRATSTTNPNRTSAPPGSMSEASRNLWAPPLGQVVERGTSPANSDAVDNGSDRLAAPTMSARPKSTDFSGAVKAATSNLDEQLSPMIDGRNWASLVNTPLVPMFDTASAAAPVGLDAAAMKLANWSLSNTHPSSRVVLDDARKFRRTSGAAKSENMGVYGDDGTLLGPAGQGQPGVTPPRKVSGGNTFLGGQTWNGAGPRSPALSNVSSGRFGSDDGGLAAAAGFGMGATPPMGLGMGMGMGMPLAGMNGMNGMNMGLGGFGMLGQMNMGQFNPALAQLGPEAQAQLFAAQMAAAGGAGWGAGAAFGGRGGMRGMGMGGMRAPGKPGSNAGGSVRGGGDKEEEVDPALLNDVPAWLRSLRLHKYTPNFEGVTWKEMVAMDEEALEAKGVAALGARRKMLKTFELVRAKMAV